MNVEERHGQDFGTRAEATHSVFGYMKGWYNTTRTHSSLGYRSPAQFERAREAKLIEAANDDLSTVSNQHGYRPGCIKERLKPSMKSGQEQTADLFVWVDAIGIAGLMNPAQPRSSLNHPMSPSFDVSRDLFYGHPRNDQSIV